MAPTTKDGWTPAPEIAPMDLAKTIRLDNGRQFDKEVAILWVKSSIQNWEGTFPNPKKRKGIFDVGAMATEKLRIENGLKELENLFPNDAEVADLRRRFVELVK